MQTASAQSLPERKVLHRNVLWLSLNSSFHFKNNWGVLADASHRRSDFARQNDLSLVRIAPAYWIRSNMFVAAGYAHLWTALAAGNNEALLNENRIYQQFNHVWQKGKGTITQRLRLEERWRQLEIDGHPSDRYGYTTRYRYLLSFRHPVGRDKKSPSVILADEIMLHSGKAVTHGHFEQNRIFGGIQLKLGQRTSLESGYMYTWQKSLNGYTFNSIHTLRLTLSHDWLESTLKNQ